MTPRLPCALVLAALMAVGGCTGGSSGSSANRRSYQTMLDECAAWCEEWVAARCEAGSTVSECMDGVGLRLLDPSGSPVAPSELFPSAPRASWAPACFTYALELTSDRSY